MLVGALDPMEGSVVILPGSGLVALGSLVGQSDRHSLVFRVWVFILIALGVGAMWGLSMAGGLGGNSGHSMWWGVLILPYLIGWSIGIWGPGSPPWLLLAGMVVGLWYLVIMGIVLKGPAGHHGAGSNLPAVVIGSIGVLTIAGCLTALLRRRARPAH